MKFKKGHTINNGRTPWNKGKEMSEETKKKVSEAKKGKTSWNKGKPAPWISKRNKETNHLMRGENTYHWKGGTYGTERHREMSRQEYKIWRLSVFERDNWTCQSCGIRGVYLEAHHPKTWKEYPELRFDVNNGVTLCKPCHNLITFSKNK